MNTLELKKYPHKIKNGIKPEAIAPNVTESCFLSLKGKVIGFYLRELPNDLRQFLRVANVEFRSKRVPKDNMNRGSLEQAKRQRAAIAKLPKVYQFGTMFTSSISNFNISAQYHQDRANIKETVNIILTRRHQAEGGNLTVPDYGLTFDQSDYSMLVYPAWANMHGVTPIIPKKEGGYRNSFIFYPIDKLSD